MVLKHSKIENSNRYWFDGKIQTKKGLFSLKFFLFLQRSITTGSNEFSCIPDVGMIKKTRHFVQIIC